MDVIAAYRDVGTYRGAAEICGTTHKTVRRIIAAHEVASRGEVPAPRVARGKNYESVADLVAEKVTKTAGKISAKRLPIAYRLPSRFVESVLVAAGGLAAAAGLLTITPMTLGFTLIAAVLALFLGATGVGISLVGYDHSHALQNVDPGPQGARIVDLHRPDDYPRAAER